MGHIGRVNIQCIQSLDLSQVNNKIDYMIINHVITQILLNATVFENTSLDWDNIEGHQVSVEFSIKKTRAKQISRVFQMQLSNNVSYN